MIASLSVKKKTGLFLKHVHKQIYFIAELYNNMSYYEMTMTLTIVTTTMTMTMIMIMILKGVISYNHDIHKPVKQIIL